MKMQQFSKNIYVDALAKLCFCSAVFHGILCVIIVATGRTSEGIFFFNYFHLLSLDLFWPALKQGIGMFFISMMVASMIGLVCSKLKLFMSVFPNRRLNILVSFLTTSALLHDSILIIAFLTKKASLFSLDYFGVMELDYFFPFVGTTQISLITGWITMGLIYALFYWMRVKTKE